MMHSYFAVVEPDGSGGFWLSFPGHDGIVTAADSVGKLVLNAQDALESAVMYGGPLPRSIEEGAEVPTNLADYYDNPLIIVVLFDPATVKRRVPA